MHFSFNFGVNKKLDQLATIIDETTGNTPLDESAAVKVRERTLEQEVVSAIEDLKEVAQALVQSSNPNHRHLARRLIVSRAAFKLLARTHFPAKPLQKK